MSNTGAYEAHVQVLTAEVRTLVVGSRQVTMSVYNQLDQVLPRDIEPFGRVNPKDVSDRSIWVIGREVATGALAQSYVRRSLEGLNDDFVKTCYADMTRQELAEVAKQWSALPLIVLAGLR